MKRFLALIILALASFAHASSISSESMEWQGVMTGPYRFVAVTAVPPIYTYVQRAVTADGTFTQAITPGAVGRFIEVAADLECPGVPTIADTQGNFWSQDITLDTTSTTASSYTLFHTLAKATSSTTITVTPTGSCFHGGLDTREYSGVNVLDIATANVATGYSAPTGTLGTNQDGELTLFLGDISTATGPFINRGALSTHGIGAALMEGTSTGVSTVYTDTVSTNPWTVVGAGYRLGPTVTPVSACTGNNASGRTATCTVSGAGAQGDAMIATSKTNNNSGTAALAITSASCSDWQLLVPPNSGGTAAGVNTAMYGCILPAPATPAVTATWTGATASGPFTDLSVKILHSTETWNYPLLDRSTSQVNSTSSTNCPTGSGGVTNNPNDYWIAVCENFLVGETWGTMAGYTNDAAASTNTVGIYTRTPYAVDTLSATVPMSGADKSTGMLVALQATDKVNCSKCTFVQSANSANQTPQYDHISLSGVKPGNTLIYWSYHTNWSGSGTTTMGDSTGVNHWFPCSTNTGGATSVSMTDLPLPLSQGMSCFYAPNVQLGGTVTGLPTSSDCAVSCTNVGGTMMEISGASVWDGSSHTAPGAVSTSGADNVNCGSATTTKANDFMVCAISIAGTGPTAGSLPAPSTRFSTTNGYLEYAVWPGVGATTQTMNLSTGSGVSYGGIGVWFK